MSGQHTSRTDLAAAEKGRERAEALGPISRGWDFSLVLTSPLLRARETCELAGFGDRAVSARTCANGTTATTRA